MDLPEDFDTDWLIWEDTSWMDDNHCAETDPELFFPETGGAQTVAKTICLTCPVRDLCLDYGLRHPKLQGIWGGADSEQRKRLRRGQPVELVKACRSCGCDMPGGMAVYHSPLCQRQDEWRKKKTTRQEGEAA